jgi:hypothetical protein
VKIDRTTRLILAGCAVASTSAVLLSMSAMLADTVASVPDLDFKASDYIASAAVVLSLFALVRPLWNERKASIEVRSERYRRVQGDQVRGEQRYVMKNHGPAQARDVQVMFFSDGKPVKLHLSGWNHRPYTPLLHPGEEMHMNYTLAMGKNMPEKVVVAWRDGRIGRQSQEFYPSNRDL